ncbi:hypothetical protein DYB31_012994 [Aphanomyces astaci]|uniref:Acyltransferase 3 domain-containing protein n=1 Tax=Aphanomyces astaci TaxID=112090 RepID=A0A397FKT4_APHAT|nr:hypothetical protein DYB31_012994 [Aphanomyces astaci]
MQLQCTPPDLLMTEQAKNTFVLATKAFFLEVAVLLDLDALGYIIRMKDHFEVQGSILNRRTIINSPLRNAVTTLVPVIPLSLLRSVLELCHDSALHDIFMTKRLQSYRWGCPKSTTADTSNGVDTAEFAVLAEEATPPEPKYPIKYPPDIDGLRTLAVVPVVLLHAYPLSINGGFTGVDVFFVISGYLISGILFKEKCRSSFTYAYFYSHSIFPALLLAVQSFTLVAGTLFGANIQLLTVQQGYFDASVKENPLLHLWSLGVEEQF